MIYISNYEMFMSIAVEANMIISYNNSLDYPRL
jgi:hypothetical protein